MCDFKCFTTSLEGTALKGEYFFLKEIYVKVGCSLLVALENEKGTVIQSMRVTSDV